MNQVDNCNLDLDQRNGVDSGPSLSAVNGKERREQISVQLDRQKYFVIDDDPGLGPEVFLATKTLTKFSRRLVHNKITAIALS